MKKIILFLAILSVGLIASCSKDEDSNGSTPDPNPNPTPGNVFKAKVNGDQKNFKVISATQIPSPDPEEDYTSVEIVAEMIGDPTNTFELGFDRESGEVYFVQYVETGTYYQGIPEAPPSENMIFPIALDSGNTAKIMRGTFYGTMQETDSGPGSVTITDGTFEIHF
ncbi:hypothetical protein FEDK69T_28030 [Flavobacterium enshiense DK69]|uniref:Lipoprotein n=1 Tax=Flavobacterium enshiense DK69 TaxID=1107311 RepID=V6S7C7_9FLAO|nr:hypothetical protein [Flavobacterium enshiense]ESU20290.1 hypothetical protein FEDK69T_28030 [Flavobacterium enshiense DK69]KGO95898.1 hypothetical protein Q767_09460 [Flavobacterium enshiense DK69]